MEFNGNTKLTDILNKYPWLPDALEKLDGRFKIIKTPVGKMMIRNMTLSDMSKKINFPENDIINKLKQMIADHNA